MKKFGIKIVLFTLVACFAATLIPNKAEAAFRPGLIIDDYVFTNTASFSAAQIDAFLNSKNSCISTNSGFSAPEPTGYSPSGGFQYGGNVTAGTVIARSAQVYGLNPQVLLVTLQKEQSIVTTSSCSTNTIAKAVGYGCPDSGGSYSYSGLNLYTRNGVTYTSVNGTCVNSASKAGFSQQIIRAAWMLKFSQERSLGNTGWAVITGSWDNSDDRQSCYSGAMTAGWRKACPNGPTVYYDGYTTIDGQSVLLGSGATAALYRYTPHFHGNQNFVTIWENWWGPSLGGTFKWATGGYAVLNPEKTVTHDPGHLQPGVTYLARLQAVNTGTATWMKGGPNPTVLSTNYPVNHASPLCHPTWPACSRPATLLEDQIEPGQIGHFEFLFVAPARAGSYGEYFKPVAEMLSWFNDYSPNDGFGIHVDSPGTYVWSTNGYTVKNKSGQTVDSTQLKPGEKYDVTLTATNTGTATWKNGGPFPVTLATSNPKSSSYCSSAWITCQRPVKLQESSIAPGQTGNFVFEIQAPLVTGTYREWFKPVAEMYSWFNDAPFNELSITSTAGSYRWSTTGFVVKNQSNQTVNPAQLQVGQTYTATVDALNTGTATWTNTGATPVRLATSNPTSRMSTLCHNSWIGCNRPVVLTEASVAPGETGHFTFTFVAPSTGTYREWFKPVAENLSWFNDAPYNELGVKTAP